MAKKKETETRTERLTMLIAPSLKERAQAEAERQGRTLSNYVERLILQDLESKGR